MLTSHPKKKHELVFISLKFFLLEIWVLVKSPVFILLTIMGNTLIALFSLLFYFIEKDKNDNIHGFIDALWWGMSTATTTGFGDIIPVTSVGKLLGILLMLTGMALFAMFTALFAETILNNSKNHKH